MTVNDYDIRYNVQTNPEDHCSDYDGKGTSEGTAAIADVGELVRLLLDDRQVQEEELARKQARCEAAEVTYSKQIKEQLAIVCEMLERSIKHDEHVNVDSDTPQQTSASTLHGGRRF